MGAEKQSGPDYFVEFLLLRRGAADDSGTGPGPFPARAARRPTHLILGDEDALVPRVTTRSLATGHLMMIERPEPVHQVLLASLQDFLRQE